jgi:RNA polymerase sigma-70 factor (ECF subfamily)
MEDPTPPAESDGPPPAAGGGVAPSPGLSSDDWVNAVQRHGQWLRRVILTRLGEPQAVEEVMQEVSLAAVATCGADGLAGAGAPANIASWLYRVAVRQTLLYRRRSGRRRKLIGAVARRLGSSGAAPSPDPLGWLLSAERDDLVRRAVGRLPRRDADVLVLKYTEQWSYRQLAEHLGLSESAVEARLHRARRRLREELVRLNVTEDAR